MEEQQICEVTSKKAYEEYEWFSEKYKCTAPTHGLVHESADGSGDLVVWIEDHEIGMVPVVLEFQN